MPGCLMTKNLHNIFENRWQRWINSFFVNLSVIIVFCGTGYLVDVYMNTKPWAFIILLLVSFPVSLGIQIYQIKKK